MSSSSSFYNLSNPSVTGVSSLEAQLVAAETQLTQATTLSSTIAAYSTELSNLQTGTSYTLVLSDAGKCVTMSSSSANSITVPPNSSVAFPLGSWINIVQQGSGTTSVTPGSGVTVNTGVGLNLRAQYSGASLLKTDTNTWILVGDLGWA